MSWSRPRVLDDIMLDEDANMSDSERQHLARRPRRAPSTASTVPPGQRSPPAPPSMASTTPLQAPPQLPRDSLQTFASNLIAEHRVKKEKEAAADTAVASMQEASTSGFDLRGGIGQRFSRSDEGKSRAYKVLTTSEKKDFRKRWASAKFEEMKTIREQELPFEEQVFQTSVFQAVPTKCPGSATPAQEFHGETGNVFISSGRNQINMASLRVCGSRTFVWFRLKYQH